MTIENNPEIKEHELSFSVYRETWHGVIRPANSYSHTALWIESGSLDINGIGISAGSGFYIEPHDKLENTQQATVLRFVVGREIHQETVNGIESALVLEKRCTVAGDAVILRLDQVDFPPAAIAYRHTHPGAGIRYLVCGGLQIKSDHGVEHIQPQQAWFEAANTPVEATAIEQEPSCFVRLMLLPLEYEGKATFTFADIKDADKPRLQKNIRYVDTRITL